MFKMYQQWLSSLLFTSAQLLTLTAAAPQFDPSLPSAGPNAGFNPRSVEALASRDYFYVGGKYVKADPPANGTIMVGQIYVEHLQPCEVRQKYPLVLWHGAAQTGTNWLNTPDGRKGWASYFLEQGYELVCITPSGPDRGCALTCRNSILWTSRNVDVVRGRLIKARSHTSAPMSWSQLSLHRRNTICTPCRSFTTNGLV